MADQQPERCWLYADAILEERRWTKDCRRRYHQGHGQQNFPADLIILFVQELSRCVLFTKTPFD